ncbi:hypothetical protein ACFL7M_15645 [Thermodesulfobacteriota bacterium]
MKNAKISICFLIVVLILYAFFSYAHRETTIALADQAKLEVTLDVIRAFDMRLPVLSDDDFKMVLQEANRIISIKLGSEIK